MSDEKVTAYFGNTLQIIPGVHNALSAVIAESAGFHSLFVTGAGVSNNFLGEPDLGFLTFDQLKCHVEQIRMKVGLPIFVDMDAGFGDAKCVNRYGRQLHALGVAGIFLEDQVQPKRCGHFSGKQIVLAEEMQEKVRALREVSPELIIVARTDALASEGLDASLRRATAYRDAGADATFVEAPVSKEQMHQIALLPWPQIINMVEGGKTPLVSRAELREMGFAVALYANFASRMAMQAMKVAYRSLFLQGDTSVLLDEMISFEERQTILGLSEWQDSEQRWIDKKLIKS